MSLMEVKIETARWYCIGIGGIYDLKRKHLMNGSAAWNLLISFIFDYSNDVIFVIQVVCDPNAQHCQDRVLVNKIIGSFLTELCVRKQIN